MPGSSFRGGRKLVCTFSRLRQFSIVGRMRTLALVATVGPMDGPDDRSQIIAVARAGDLAAFEALMRQYERLVLATALRLLGNLEEAEALPATSAGPQQTAGEAERRRALELSLRRLSERERVAVVLRDLEGLSTGEVARAMGSSEATVRSQISQARVKMRGFLERYFRRHV